MVQLPQAQVKFRLLVLFRPMWVSQTWSCRGAHHELCIADRECDSLRRVIREYQPSFHILPIGTHSYQRRCLTAELLVVETAVAVVIAVVAVAVVIAIAIADVEAVVAAAGAVLVAGDGGGGMVAGHDANTLAFAGMADAVAVGAVVAVAVAVVVAVMIAAVAVAVADVVVVVAAVVVHVAERYRRKDQWWSGLGPGLVPRT